MSAPRVEISLDAIGHNARTLVARLGARGIRVTAVTKAVLGSSRVAAVLVAAGCPALADSRVANVAALRRAGMALPITLIRSPMRSEVRAVVESCSASHNTEPQVLVDLSAAAVSRGVTHGVVIMVELGDRREGVLPEDLEGIARQVMMLPNLTLHGIGTNLACRSGVVPDATNMGELSALAAGLEGQLRIRLAVVSGGNSANLRWALGADPVGRIDELRLGEAILLGRDPLDRSPIDGLRTDGFRLVAEVIESKSKPSLPAGALGESAFGRPDHPGDRGQVVQSILAIGRQDVDPDDLTPPAGVRIVASSSDHLVVETARLLPIGAELAFQPGYSALLRMMTSPYVDQIFVPQRVSPAVPITA